MHACVYCIVLASTWDDIIISLPMQGFLDLKWSKWKRVLLTRSVAMVPCVIIAILAVNVLDTLSDYINVEQSLLVRTWSAWSNLSIIMAIVF